MIDNGEFGQVGQWLLRLYDWKNGSNNNMVLEKNDLRYSPIQRIGCREWNHAEGFN